MNFNFENDYLNYGDLSRYSFVEKHKRWPRRWRKKLQIAHMFKYWRYKRYRKLKRPIVHMNIIHVFFLRPPFTRHPIRRMQLFNMNFFQFYRYWKRYLNAYKTFWTKLRVITVPKRKRRFFQRTLKNNLFRVSYNWYFAGVKHTFINKYFKFYWYYSKMNDWLFNLLPLADAIGSYKPIFLNGHYFSMKKNIFEKGTQKRAISKNDYGMIFTERYFELLENKHITELNALLPELLVNVKDSFFGESDVRSLDNDNKFVSFFNVGLYDDLINFMLIEEDLREDEGNGRYWLKRLETHFVVKENEEYEKEFRFLYPPFHNDRHKMYNKFFYFFQFGVQFSAIFICIGYGAIYGASLDFKKIKSYLGLDKRAVKHLDMPFIRNFISPFEQRVYLIRQIKYVNIPYIKIIIFCIFVFFVFLF